MAVEMEQQAIKLVDIVHGDREVDFQETANTLWNFVVHNLKV